MVNLEKKLILTNELGIKGGDYPSQYPKYELFRFFLRRAAGKEAAMKVLLKMYVTMKPLEEIQKCFECILDSYIEFCTQMQTISNQKIKKMRQGLTIHKPKFLKNGQNYFDKDEIEKIPEMLRNYYYKKRKESDLVPEELKISNPKIMKLDVITSSEEKMDIYFFEVLSLLFYMLKDRGLDSEFNTEDVFLQWCIKFEKWSLILQLSQGAIFSENFSLSLLFCELGSKTKLLDQLKEEFSIVQNLKKGFLSNIPNLGKREFLQMGLQYLKKQKRLSHYFFQ